MDNVTKLFNVFGAVHTAGLSNRGHILFHILILKKNMLGGPLEISNFVRRESELVALPDQKLAGEQQPDTTIEMQRCSSDANKML